MRAYRSLPFIIIPLLLSLSAAGCTGAPRPAVADGTAKRTVVARVNGVELTASALNETVERMRSSKHGQPAADREDARKRALDQMVLQELAVQEASRQGVRVADKDLNAAMNTLTANLGHGEGFEAFLKERGLTAEEVRSQVGRRLLLEAIYDREVRSKVSVSPDEVRKEYDLNKKAYVAPEKASVIDIAFTQKHGAQAMLKKAEEVLAAASAGREPATVPANDIFTIQEREIDARREPQLFGAARNLAEGAYSGLIESPGGSHIVKLVRVVPEKQLAYEEAQENIERKLRGIAELRRFAEWQEELKKNAVIELLP